MSRLLILESLELTVNPLCHGSDERLCDEAFPEGQKLAGNPSTNCKHVNQYSRVGKSMGFGATLRVGLTLVLFIGPYS